MDASQHRARPPDDTRPGVLLRWVLGKIIDKTMGFRVSEEDEVTGVDLSQHAETAYDFLITQLGHTSSHAVAGASQDAADREAEAATGTF